VVFASNFLEHLEWDAIDRCVAGAWRVLRPGGRLLLVQPNFRLQPGAYFDDYTHRTIFTDRSLSDYLAVQGFEIEHVEARFLPLTLRSRLSWGHKLVPLYLRLPYRPLAGQMLVVARRPAEAKASPPAEAKASPPAEAKASPAAEAKASPPAEAKASPPAEAKASPPAEANGGARVAT
jgi:hypothetical protein